MRRRQLIELEDLPWCPRVIRDGGTDWLGFIANTTHTFDRVAPKIRAAMIASGTDEILDLCSGGGGPWLTLREKLAKSGPVRVTLSDRYPNMSAWADMQQRSDGRRAFRVAHIDATNVPIEFRGVRTMFNAFHHFPPDIARAILADAVRKRRAIAIFEGTNRRAIGWIAMPLQIPVMLLFTPFVRPFRWSRLLFTYVLPLIPLLILWDGTVSFLRLYLNDELQELVTSVPGHETFEWEIGSLPAWAPVGIPYLIGVPRKSGTR